MIDLTIAKNAAQAAFEASRNPTAIGSVGGCGRVYVEVHDVNYKGIRKGSKVAKAFEAAGFRMTERPHQSGVRIYVGYDNATGREWNRGEIIARVLKEKGVLAYVDGDGD